MQYTGLGRKNLCLPPYNGNVQCAWYEYTPQLCTSTTSPYIEHLSEYINILPKNMYNLIGYIGESQCFVKKKEILAFGLVRKNA